MDLYIGYKNFDIDLKGVGPAAVGGNIKASQDFDAVVMGAIIKF